MRLAAGKQAKVSLPLAWISTGYAVQALHGCLEQALEVRCTLACCNACVKSSEGCQPRRQPRRPRMHAKLCPNLLVYITKC